MKFRLEDPTGGSPRLVDAETGSVITGIKSVTLFAGVDHPTRMDIEVMVVEVNTVAGEVRWHGLQSVPLEALEDELARRRRDAAREETL